jgi:prepilin-type N-terminal cleavage/methylation domain-containing protein
MKRREGFTLIELMIVIAIIAIIAAIAIPGLLQSQRASNERNASASLKTCATAQADLRSNDRDGNKNNDFWTYNVAGLMAITAPGAGAVTTNAIKLVEPAVGCADGRPFATTGLVAIVIPGGNGSILAPSSFGRLSPKAGYWYQALVSDASSGVNVIYNTATVAGGSVMFNNTAYGMAAYPDSMSSGRQMFIVNESNTMYKRQVIALIKGATANPPAQTMVAAGAASGAHNPNIWPSDTSLQSFYGRMD